MIHNDWKIDAVGTGGGVFNLFLRVLGYYSNS